MKTISVFAALFGVLLFHSTSRAQRTPPAEGLDFTRQEPPRSDFFAENGMARFRLRSGRLHLDRSCYRKGSAQFAVPPENEEFTETISVMAARGLPSMHYSVNHPEQRISVSVQDATWMRIESTLTKTGEQAILEQPHHGELVWTVQRGQLNEKYRGASLIHLLAQDSTGIKLHCGDLFRQLLDGRCLMQIHHQTQVELMGQLENIPEISDTAVDELIEGLRSDRASSRRHAMKQLLQLGRPAAPMLRKVLLSNDLEIEQRERIQEVLAQILSVEDDTPASLASSLANDREHWRHVAHRMTDAQIRLVDQRLTGLNLAHVAGLDADSPRDRISSRPR
ncbi:hypothetical protein [Stieleria varia]|uniref:HEAT repeat protein n=1 Tax=Stieleria varia TaxID=2528005 RepID=A0A5C6AFR5_9BACT|nr:hypothetical protein [Stieleria varia]TWT98266.1 hypothetical protein Pla52n_47760 [Stieleria varia]